jgi:hypothetical protein
MTTIAANRHSIASDLQYTHASGMKMKGGSKIYKIPEASALKLFNVKVAYVGFCGNADKFADVIAWLSEPSENYPKTKGLEMLMLTEDHRIWHGTTVTNWMEILEPHFAIGSGMHFAQSAMACGKTPKEAVHIASKYDPSTGQGVKEFKL